MEFKLRKIHDKNDSYTIGRLYLDRPYRFARTYAKSLDEIKKNYSIRLEHDNYERFFTTGPIKKILFRSCEKYIVQTKYQHIYEITVTK